MLAELLSIVAPVYLCAALGFWWARSGRPYDVDLVTELIMTIGAPCLVFTSLSRVELDGGALLAISGATLAALATFAVIGSLVLRVAGLPANTFLGPLVFMNAGNMGLPLCLFAFGEPGLALGACFFAVTAITHFSVGEWVWSGRASPAALLRTPLVYAVVASVLVLWTGVEVPRWLDRGVTLLSGFTIPLMQFSLGVSLARLELAHVPRTLTLATLRMVLGLLVGIGLAALFGLEGLVRSVFILDCAMPAAVFNYMFAQRYARSPAEVASVVVLSTLISFATVPLLLAWLLP